MTSGAQSRWLLDFYWSHAEPSREDRDRSQGSPWYGTYNDNHAGKGPSPRGTHRFLKSYRSHRKKSRNGSRLRRLSHRYATRDYRSPPKSFVQRKKKPSESLLVLNHRKRSYLWFRIIIKLLDKLMLFTRLKRKTTNLSQSFLLFSSFVNSFLQLFIFF